MKGTVRGRITNGLHTFRSETGKELKFRFGSKRLGTVPVLIVWVRTGTKRKVNKFLHDCKRWGLVWKRLECEHPEDLSNLGWETPFEVRGMPQGLFQLTDNHPSVIRWEHCLDVHAPRSRATTTPEMPLMADSQTKRILADKSARRVKDARKSVGIKENEVV
jgi:hypothetical protein